MHLNDTIGFSLAKSQSLSALSGGYLPNPGELIDNLKTFLVRQMRKLKARFLWRNLKMISLLNGHVNHILLNLKYSIYFHGITCDMNFLSHFQSVIKRNINTKYEARIFSHLRCPTSFGISKPYKWRGKYWKQCLFPTWKNGTTEDIFFSSGRSVFRGQPLPPRVVFTHERSEGL